MQQQQQHSSEAQGSHLLSLKVMRLSKPSLVTKIPLYYEKNPSAPSNSPIADALESLSISDIVTVHSLPNPSDGAEPEHSNESISIRDFSLSQVLTLPSSFGNIYLGETFTSYICVNNDSKITCKEVLVKCELQTTSQRFTLTDTTNRPVPTVEFQQTCEFVVSHEIKELGVHILVCSVQYTPASPENAEKKSFRKYFKFQVLNPLAVKTKVNNMADGRVFLEAQVQNVATISMFLDRMSFESAEPFIFHDLNTVIEKNSTANESSPLIFGTHAYLSPADTRQYLYLLQPKNPLNDRLARTTNALGKLDIIWRSTFGETGRLQTSQLIRKPPMLDDIEIQPHSLPTIVLLEQPFSVGVSIRNRSAQSMKLALSTVKNKMGSVLLSGGSNRNLGEVLPDGLVQVEVEFFPLTPGLQRVGGLKVTDLISGIAREIEGLCDVFVQVKDDEIFTEQ